MNATPHTVAKAAIAEFDITGQLVGLEPFERGHIHNTFVSTFRDGAVTRRYLHQQINAKIFGDVPGLMHNIESVTTHLKSKLGQGCFRTLQLVQTRLGKSFLAHESGPWRTYDFVENTRSFDLCESSEQAYAAARAFGQFQAELIDLDIEGLRETIPNFFSSTFRMLQFEDALEADPKGRAAAASDDIDFARKRKSMVGVIAERIRAGAFPRRIVHGDTKLNNILFDNDTGAAVCVVDLDTVMPAYSLYDFGDLVRFTAATCSEDEQDLSRASTDMQLYAALRQGYLESAGCFLTGEEIALMPFSARLVTFTIGLRFLTDHLAGDVYFKTSRQGHNLDRARVQFAMVACMEQNEKVMAKR